MGDGTLYKIRRPRVHRLCVDSLVHGTNGRDELGVSEVFGLGLEGRATTLKARFTACLETEDNLRQHRCDALRCSLGHP